MLLMDAVLNIPQSHGVFQQPYGTLLSNKLYRSFSLDVNVSQQTAASGCYFPSKKADGE